jgi:hypothetical protein
MVQEGGVVAAELSGFVRVIAEFSRGDGFQLMTRRK